MALPGVTTNVLDGNLGLQQGSNEQVVLLMGVCTDGTPDTLYSVGNQTALTDALGRGSLVEAAAYCLQVGGGPVMCLPLTPDTAGASGSVTHTGPGAGTLTVSSAPHESVTITCATSGTIVSGTAAFTFTVGSETSAPVTAAAAWSSTGYRIPGTYTTYIFTTGTYVGSGGTADVYTISTAGTLAHPTGAGPAVGTQTSSPLDNYNVKATIVTSGALGTATFTYSLDNGDSALDDAGTTSAEIVTAGSGIYAIPNSGVVLTFAGALNGDDTYTFKTAGPSCSSLTSALTALETTYLAQAQYAMVGVIQMPHSASGWGTNTATLQATAEELFNSGVFVRFMNECPTVGSVFVSGSLVTDTADTDSVLIAARASVEADRVLTGAGDGLLLAPVSGLFLRRSALWPAIARASSVEASQNLGFVGLGGVSSVVHIFRNETATPGLDAAGFTTLRQINGVPGFYITDAHTLALATSDYYPFTNARVIDIACTISRANALPLVNSKVPTTTRDGNPGVITEKKAQQIESRINGALDTSMVSTQPQNAVATDVTVDREHNILADGNLIIAVAVQPFAYARTITQNIGMAVQA